MRPKHDTSCLDPISKTYITHAVTAHFAICSEHQSKHSAVHTMYSQRVDARRWSALPLRLNQCVARCCDTFPQVTMHMHQCNAFTWASYQLAQRLCYVCLQARVRTALMPVRCSHQWPYYFRDASGVLLISDQLERACRCCIAQLCTYTIWLSKNEAAMISARQT